MFKRISLWFAGVCAFLAPASAFAVTPYDDLVTIADLSGLGTIQLTLLGIVVTMSLVTTAAVILIGLLRKGRAGAR